MIKLLTSEEKCLCCLVTHQMSEILEYLRDAHSTNQILGFPLGFQMTFVFEGVDVTVTSLRIRRLLGLSDRGVLRSISKISRCQLDKP